MLPEISLNVMDIAQNSVRAQASLITIEIEIDTKEGTLRLVMDDNGYGMSEEETEKVTDPFFTSRTTRKVGLGVPFVKQAAEITGGSFSIESEEKVGTKLCAIFNKASIDCMPLGDICSTIYLLVISYEKIDFLYRYTVDDRSFTLDTRQMRDICGGIPFSNPDISEFIKSYLTENTDEVNQGQVF
jgi:anti-sigma regulatory factor (Ser/Thr protein kinase)